ncbi:MAG: hypothetical protein H0W78_14615 [Planctomycetes bacterium]|nr:hypothetical protein [Planctomycetota bacterium]
MTTTCPSSRTHALEQGRLRRVRRDARQGFTLFEVSISLVLVAFGVISVLMLFPSGLKAQQMARFQIYAAAKAEEMLEQFNGTQHSNPAIDTEGMAMWDVPVAHKAQSWDLESRLSAHRFGIMPLPLTLARRLDSDGDEIQQILDEGGFLYYSQPLASTGTQEQGAAEAPPNEAQKMIIAVKGYAQQNCLSSFPLKNWPYHTPFPSPPLQMHHMADKFLPQRVNRTMGNYKTDYYQYYSWPWMDNEDQIYRGRWNIRNHSETYCVPWETSPPIPPLFPGDPDIQKVYDWPDDVATHMVAPNYPVGAPAQVQPLHVGYFPYACGRLWEAGGTNPGWIEWDVPPSAGPPAIAGTRHPYGIGTLVTRNGTNYTCLVAHLAENGVNGPPPNATYWAQVPIEFPSTHLEQITRSKSTVGYMGVNDGVAESGQAVYGEYPSRPSVGRYVASTLWYAEKKGFSWGSLGTVKDPYLDFTDSDSRNHWKEVQAFRFLAHATTCLTGWYSFSSSEMENLNTGVTIPRVSLAGIQSPDNVKITHDLIKYYHERSLHLINLYAASYPNDWMVPRPLNRAIMMDFPLLQFDMFVPWLPQGLPSNPLYSSTTETPPQQGMTISLPNEDYRHIFGRNAGDRPEQWRVVSSEPIRNIGVSATFPTNIIDSRMQTSSHTSHFGHPEHFNLTAKFDAAERCRELIFWVADWQSYEDFETAPSAPVDASKYPLGAPRSEWHESAHIIPTNRTRNFSQRMGDLEFRDEQLWSYRNAEKTLLFFGVDPTTLATGTDMTNNMVLNRPWTNYPDKGSGVNERRVFNGLLGADRNYNKKLDRGPLPKSVRLRAVQVARFNFYDPRVQAILR